MTAKYQNIVALQSVSGVDRFRLLFNWYELITEGHLQEAIHEIIDGESKYEFLNCAWRFIYSKMIFKNHCFSQLYFVNSEFTI